MKIKQQEPPSWITCDYILKICNAYSVYLRVGMCVSTCVRVEGRITLLISGPPVGVHRPIYLRLISLSPQRLQLKGDPEEQKQAMFGTSNYEARVFRPQSLYISVRTDQHILCCA